MPGPGTNKSSGSLSDDDKNATATIPETFNVRRVIGTSSTTHAILQN